MSVSNSILDQNVMAQTTTVPVIHDYEYNHSINSESLLSSGSNNSLTFPAVQWSRDSGKVSSKYQFGIVAPSILRLSPSPISVDVDSSVSPSTHFRFNLSDENTKLDAQALVPLTGSGPSEYRAFSSVGLRHFVSPGHFAQSFKLATSLQNASTEFRVFGDQFTLMAKSEKRSDTAGQFAAAAKIGAGLSVSVAGDVFKAQKNQLQNRSIGLVWNNGSFLQKALDTTKSSTYPTLKSSSVFAKFNVDSSKWTAGAQTSFHQSNLQYTTKLEGGPRKCDSFQLGFRSTHGYTHINNPDCSFNLSVFGATDLLKKELQLGVQTSLSSGGTLVGTTLIGKDSHPRFGLGFHFGC